MSVAIDIAVEAPAWERLPEAEAGILRAIQATMTELGVAQAEVGVVLGDDASIRALNRRWRGKDEATNVLSFPAADGAPGGAKLLGDAVFALQTIEREAAEMGKPVADHLAHLAVHATLHLLGFDHEHDDAADIMEQRERRILAGLGIPDPYADARRTELA
jgi:probable rRNA maturation factor